MDIFIRSRVKVRLSDISVANEACCRRSMVSPAYPKLLALWECILQKRHISAKLPKRAYPVTDLVLKLLQRHSCQYMSRKTPARNFRSPRLVEKV